MKIERIAIKELKFDENQPRKTFPQDKIDAMAESIKAQGLLEPILIDENNKIVNGECRVRGCKKAGLNEVDVIRMNPKDQNDRWIKQLVSNYHRIPEEPLEQARILEKLTKLYSDRQFRKQGVDSGIREISRLTGIIKDTIENRLTLIEAPKEIQQAIERKEIKPTYVIEASKAEPEHRKEIYKKIKEGKYRDRDQIRDEIKYKKEIDKVNEVMNNPIITPQMIADQHYDELNNKIRLLSEYLLVIPNGIMFNSMQKQNLSEDIKELILRLKELVAQSQIAI
jgi:ParB family chromosome partitioning protein